MVALSRVPIIGGIVRRVGAAINWRVEAAVAERLRWLDERLQRLELIDLEVQRISPQVAALEIRLADREFADRVIAADSVGATDRELAEQEHRRINARLQAISHYEERLRRLELRPDSGTVESDRA